MISAEDFLASVGMPSVPTAVSDRSGAEACSMDADDCVDIADGVQWSGGCAAAVRARRDDDDAADMNALVAGGADASAPNRAGGAPRRVDGTEANDLDSCREAALRLLDAAPRASGALRDRLLARGYEDGIVDDVIERLTRVDLIDDEAYARSAVRYCAGRLMGARAAVPELVRKGVDRSTAERIVREAVDEGVFEEAAWELGRRYERRTRGMDRARRLNRFWAAGGRKGHDAAELRRVADELFR